MEHTVHIRIGRKPVLGSKVLCLPKRLLTFLFGDFTEVVFLKPGSSVKSVEIHEIPEGGRL